MRKYTVTASVIAVVIALVGSIAEAAPISSTFDSGSEGWVVTDIYNYPVANPPQVLGYYGPAFHASGGNPGGFISMTDPSGYWFWFDAPAPFLGDQSSAFGGSLRFDMWVSASDGPQAYSSVMLVGPGTTLYYPTPPPANVFTTSIIPLTPPGWRTNDPDTGVQPTNLQMLAVLGNLSALRISGDWLTGVETAGLDNVVLTPIPAPGAFLLVLSGLACLRVVKKRSR